MMPEAPPVELPADFTKRLIQALERQPTVEAQMARDIGDIKKFLQGPPDKPGEGLLWRVTAIESQLTSVKRWGVVVILILGGGQPAVDRLLPAKSDALQAELIRTLQQYVQADLANTQPATNPRSPYGPPKP